MSARLFKKYYLYCTSRMKKFDDWTDISTTEWKRENIFYRGIEAHVTWYVVRKKYICRVFPNNACQWIVFIHVHRRQKWSLKNNGLISKSAGFSRKCRQKHWTRCSKCTVREQCVLRWCPAKNTFSRMHLSFRKLWWLQ